MKRKEEPHSRRTPGRACLALAAAFALCAAPRAPANPFVPASAPTNEVAVSVRVLDSNMPLVPCSVNGRDCVLLFDTGATHTTLDAAFVRRELPDAALRKVKIEGDTNVDGAPSLLHASSLKVGGAEFADFEVMALDISHIPAGIGERVDGVLGMNVIGRVLTLVSLGSGEVVFSPARGRLDGLTNAVARSLSDPFSLDIVAGRGDRRFEMLVDTGSSMTFLGEETGWPASGERADIVTTDINKNGGSISPRLGDPGELLLGIPVSIRPLVVPEPMNRIGSDTLRRYDMLVGRTRVAFRPRPQAR